MIVLLNGLSKDDVVLYEVFKRYIYANSKMESVG